MRVQKSSLLIGMRHSAKRYGVDARKHLAECPFPTSTLVFSTLKDQTTSQERHGYVFEDALEERERNPLERDPRENAIFRELLSYF